MQLSPIIKVWAIRNKNTRKFFPGYSSIRGASFVEATTTVRPRIHWSKRSAQQALAAWCRGAHIPLRDNDGLEYYSYGYKIEPQEGRKKEDYEIVEFDLTEVK